MLLKRIYDHSSGEPKLDYLSLANTGVSSNQNFSIDLVTALLEEGQLDLDDTTLVLHTVPESLIYTIKRAPGRYCLHCGEKLPDDEKGALARLHIASKHKGVPSPDSNTPSGYVMLNHFECVLNDEQHEKFRVKKAAEVPVFPRKGE